MHVPTNMGTISASNVIGCNNSAAQRDHSLFYSQKLIEANISEVAEKYNKSMYAIHTPSP